VIPGDERHQTTPNRPTDAAQGEARAARRSAEDTVLAISGLSAGYGSAAVLHGLDLAIRKGEIVVLLGANGAGKTTLMRSIVGEIRSEGSRVLNDERLNGHAPAATARLGIASVPQGRGTFNELSVIDNLRLGALLLPMSRRAAAVDTWLSRFPRLAERRDVAAGVLSGGEQQLLAIARACVTEPKILLCDEPSLGLSPAMTLQIFEAFRELNSTLGLSMLIVEQSARLALSVASYAYVLETGRIVWEGAPTALDNDSSLVAAYLGRTETKS